MASERRTFGSVVRARRQEIGMSQELLSWVAGLSRTTVSKIERGGGADPEGRTFDQIIATLGLRTAFHMNGAVHEDAGEDIAFVDAEILRWFADMFEKMRAADGPAARKTADAYVELMDVLTDIEEGDSRPSLRESARELAAFLVKAMRPYMTSGLSEGPLVDFLRQAGWSPDADQAPQARGGQLPGLQGSFQGAVDASSLEPLRAEEAMRRAAELRVTVLQQQLDEAQAIIEEQERVRHELFNAVKDYLHGPGDAALVFGRLPEQVQQILRSGHLRDWSVIPGHGMKHIRLTVQDADAQPTTAAEVLDQALLVDYALVASLVVVKQMLARGEDFRSILPEMPAVIESLGDRLQESLDGWLEKIAQPRSEEK